MEKISVKNIVEFRRKSERSRITFINNLKKPKKETDVKAEGGGDYWITASSAIGSYFKFDDKEVIANKIEDVVNRRDKSAATISKNMFQKNISLLHSFEDFDFSDLKPATDLIYLSKPDIILKIKDINVQIRPSYVYSFKENDIDRVGAIWFVTKLNGFDLNEIALFTDALHRCVKNKYKKHKIDPDYCIAIDLMSRRYVTYTQIQNKEIKSELESTLGTIRKLV